MYVLRYHYRAKSDIEWNPFFSKWWCSSTICIGDGDGSHVKRLEAMDSLWLIPGTIDPAAD